MDRNFARALALVLEHEGGWADHPHDPGGATMKGVTLQNFRRYIKPHATKAELRNISDEQVATIYRRFYWDAVQGAELPDGVDFAVFDFAVNSGPGRAVRCLQAAVGAAQDGRIGPATLAAVRARPQATVIDDLCDRRLAFLQGLRSFATFGKGWTMRVKQVRSAAMKLAGAGAGMKQAETTAHASPPVPELQAAPRPTTSPVAGAAAASSRGATGLALWLQLVASLRRFVFSSKKAHRP